MAVAMCLCSKPATRPACGEPQHVIDHRAVSCNAANDNQAIPDTVALMPSRVREAVRQISAALTCKDELACTG